MSNLSRILCVDDEPINLVIYEELLKDHYLLTTTDSGQGCLEASVNDQPDLILLDVNMPTMNGLDTCRQLKETIDTKGIPIIFVSALASDAELMAGYEAGGDDYVTKPFNQRILCKKIDVALKNREAQKELNLRNQTVANELELRQKDVGNLTSLIDFLHISHSVKSLDLLAKYAFEYLAQFSQECSLLILDSPDNKFWFSDDIDRPMEKQILESLHEQDRVIRFGSRLAINSEYTTLLIRNIPDSDAELSVLQDYVGVLLEGLDVRIKTLETKQLLEDKEQAITDVLSKTQVLLKELTKLEKSSKKALSKAQTRYSADINSLHKNAGVEVSTSRQLEQKTDRFHRKVQDICNSQLSSGSGYESVIEQLQKELQ